MTRNVRKNGLAKAAASLLLPLGMVLIPAGAAVAATPHTMTASAHHDDHGSGKNNHGDH